MKLKGSITLLLAAAASLGTVAAAQTQTRSGNGENRKSFAEFRKGILSDFRDFRGKLLEHYADFLEGEWHEYESLKGEVRDKTPKPAKAPEADNADRDPPSPVKVKPAGDAKVGPAVSTSIPPASGMTADKKKELFMFYGIPVSVPKVEFRVMRRLSTPSDYAGSWRGLTADKVSEHIVPHLIEAASGMGLNDYLTYCLVRGYVESKFPEADASGQFSAIHYLLANMGYDVRIASSVSGVPMLLLPTNQKIYARNYMMVGDERYYVFVPEGVALERVAGEGIRTCALPSDAERGKKFDLQISDLRIPEKPKSFRFEYGPLTLAGEVNENLMPILYHYPQMPVEDFALSNVSPGLREKLAAQVRTQLSGIDGDAKVEALLKFMHNVFDYSTDEDFHGFEKPYFLEETLYYPKNDCEDRAIFYTWFLWNALGRKAQLITFPGHESATVEMENPVEGTSYRFDGSTFYVSDPTFIGSRTGMVMPAYRGMDPKVDYTFGE